MPGVPTWKEIEQQVDAAVEAELAFQIESVFHLGVDTSQHRLRAWYMDRLGRNAAPLQWDDALYRMFPTVYAQLSSHRNVISQLAITGSRVWFLLRFLPDDADTQFRFIRHEWMFLQPGETTYALERVPLPVLQRLLQQLRDDLRVGSDDEEEERRPPNAMNRYRDERFEADLRVAIEERRARTNMAQSGVIDLLALHQGTPVAQHIARYLASNAAEAARPLVIRQHASQVRQLQELRATMSAVDRPAAVLARATRQLEQIVEDVHAGGNKKQRLE